MILAANYLGLKSLLESAAECRAFFGIENEFTPEEELQIMDENRWAEENF